MPLYQTVFEQLLAKCQLAVAGHGIRKKFRFKNKLVSLDASVIDLSLSLFDWAKFRRTKGTVNSADEQQQTGLLQPPRNHLSVQE